MVIALVANKNWYKYMVIDLYSLLSVTKNVKKVYLFTETDKSSYIPYLDDVIKKFKNTKIIVKNANKIINKYLDDNSLNKDSFYTDFCMVKLMFSTELKEDKVLYIDIDAIVKKDISNIWKYNIDDYYVAGCRDYGILDRGSERVQPIADKYINSGVVVFNLKKMREDNIQEKIFKIINSEGLYFPDQDALNLVCHDKTYMLSSMYNVCEGVTVPMYNRELGKIFHFAGGKDFWVASRYGSEEWYEVEERFYNEFGWDKQ